MKITLEEVAGDALIYGYDFQELVNKLKDKNIPIKEYIYGYTLSKDKVSYLESMAEGNIDYCDRIHMFSEELSALIKKVEALPLFEVFCSFFIQEDMYKEYGDTHDVSVLRIIGINDSQKEAFVRDVEYAYDNEEVDELRIWGADLDYEELISTIGTSKTDNIVAKSEDLVKALSLLETVKVS